MRLLPLTPPDDSLTRTRNADVSGVAVRWFTKSAGDLPSPSLPPSHSSSLLGTTPLRTGTTRSRLVLAERVEYRIGKKTVHWRRRRRQADLMASMIYCRMSRSGDLAKCRLRLKRARRSRRDSVGKQQPRNRVPVAALCLEEVRQSRLSTVACSFVIIGLFFVRLR